MGTRSHDIPQLLRVTSLSLLASLALPLGIPRAEELQEPATPSAAASESDSGQEPRATRAQASGSAAKAEPQRAKGSGKPKDPKSGSAPADKIDHFEVSMPSTKGPSTERNPEKGLVPSEKPLPSDSQSQGKATIGAISQAQEKQSQLSFRARVDTGAKSCSIHAVKFVIKDPAEEMQDNIGKPIRVKIQNHRDESKWIDTKIGRLVRVKTSERAELRYAVPLLLVHGELEKEVSVTLNDRSHMVYPLLLGRNFLHGDFVVDVEIPQQR